MRVATLLVAPTLLALVGCASGDVGATRVELNFAGFPDGTPPAEFNGGQDAHVSPPLSADTTLRIADGKLTYAPTRAERAAGYFSTGDLGYPITNIGAEWTYTPQAGGTPGTMALAVTHELIDAPAGKGPPMPLHYVVTRDGWEVGAWSDNQLADGGLVSLATGTFDPPLREDGETRYGTQVWLEGDTAKVELPDGRETTVSSPMISQYASNYAFFECYSNTGSTDSVVGFTRVWAAAGQPDENRN